MAYAIPRFFIYCQVLFSSSDQFATQRKRALYRRSRALPRAVREAGIPPAVRVRFLAESLKPYFPPPIRLPNRVPILSPMLSAALEPALPAPPTMFSRFSAVSPYSPFSTFREIFLLSEVAAR